MTQKVLSQVDKDGNATVALNRPEVHNALDVEMGEQLIATLKKLEANPKVRAVVIMGQGESFCAGADISLMRKSAGFSKKQNYETALAQAAILGLYDPDRSQSVMQHGKRKSWSDFVAAWGQMSKAHAADGGAGGARTGGRDAARYLRHGGRWRRDI